MNRSQAIEAFTLFTTCRHVREMNTGRGVPSHDGNLPGCIICEGVRHGLYPESINIDLAWVSGFSKHFGCTGEEARGLIFHDHSACGGDTTGENYYQAGKELLEKYGYADLFETTLSFSDLMDELKQPVSVA